MSVNKNNNCVIGGYNGYHDLIARVVRCFKPGRFLITLFANQPSAEGRQGQKDIWDREIVGYTRRDMQFLALPGGVCVFYGQYGKKKI